MNEILVAVPQSRATLPQTPKKKWKPKLNQIKYGLFFLMIATMIAAVKVYLNYANIQQNISDEEMMITQRGKDMQYLQIQDAYLTSPYAIANIGHQNQVLFRGESIAVLQYSSGLPATSGSVATGFDASSYNAETVAPAPDTGADLSPFDSWMQYFQDKWDSSN